MLLSSLTVHPLVRRITETTDILLSHWFSDDSSLIELLDCLRTTLRLIQDHGPAVGLQFILRKWVFTGFPSPPKLALPPFVKCLSMNAMTMAFNFLDRHMLINISPPPSSTPNLRLLMVLSTYSQTSATFTHALTCTACLMTLAFCLLDSEHSHSAAINLTTSN